MHSRSEISNGDDLIDSRDVIKRIAELEDERYHLSSRVETAGDSDDPGAELTEAEAELAEWDNGDDAEELKALKALEDELGGYSSDWRHGATLIRDSYFETYARECAEDMHGEAMRNASWPFDCIDWERAAEALQMDYTSGEYGGVTYWVR